MVKMIRSLAICLALALAVMLGTPPVGWAAGPGDCSIHSGPTDGGDGHPWDDGTGTDSSPVDDETDPQIQSDDPSTQPVLTIEKGFISWTQRNLISLWSKVRNVAFSQKTVTKVEYRTIKSRRVR